MKACQKTAFDTRDAAIDRLKAIKMKDPATPLKRAYYCSKCQRYHLTCKGNFKSFQDEHRAKRIESQANYFISKYKW